MPREKFFTLNLRLAIFLLIMNSVPKILSFEGTHDSSIENSHLQPVSPWVLSSEAVTASHRQEHQLRRKDYFRNFDDVPEIQSKFLDTKRAPDDEQPIFPTHQNGLSQKKLEQMFDVDQFPSYPPRRVADLFGDKPPEDTVSCFSCMSKFYQAVWPVLSTVYKRPKDFTDKCDDELIDQKYVQVMECNTICIQMTEEPTVAGVKIRGHIRGCFDDLLHKGFNQSIVSGYSWMSRDICKQYRKRELLKLPPDQSDDSLVEVCTCYEDFCNNVSTMTSMCSALILLHSISLIVVLLNTRRG